MPVTQEPATLTDAQRQAMRTIVGFIKKNGFPPTVKELSDALDFRSPNGASVHIRALIRKGYLTKQAGVARGLRVLKGPK